MHPKTAPCKMDNLSEIQSGSQEMAKFNNNNCGEFCA